MCRGTRGLSGLPWCDFAAGAWDPVAGEPDYSPSQPGQGIPAQAPASSLPNSMPPQPVPPLQLGLYSGTSREGRRGRGGGLLIIPLPWAGLCVFSPSVQDCRGRRPHRPDRLRAGWTESQKGKSRSDGFYVRESCPPCPAPEALPKHAGSSSLGSYFHSSLGGAKIVYLKIRISKLSQQRKKGTLGGPASPLPA